ncbi:MAG: SAM-dependent chlorinase/fluorinase [Nitrospirae bacterium]|nr:SAM-dependent chlorinase/fluorinase [Nitrospirota bacterium]
MPRPLITLTTDFGLRDPSVGSMKGVILSIFQDVTLVDLTHAIPPHAIASASYILGMASRYFPPGSIHVAVVDPGVGSARRPVVCSAGGQRYVGPDNGLFADICRRDPQWESFELAETRYCLKAPRLSPTFQGRDVFAPAAAWLARGTAPNAFGPRVTDLVGMESPKAGRGPDRRGSSLQDGEIIWVDRFGNLITGIEPSPGATDYVVSIGGKDVPLVTHYEEGPANAPAALVNSDGLVEVFVNRGDAARTLGASIGTPVALIPRRRAT